MGILLIDKKMNNALIIGLLGCAFAIVAIEAQGQDRWWLVGGTGASGATGPVSTTVRRPRRTRSTAPPPTTTQRVTCTNEPQISHGYASGSGMYEGESRSVVCDAGYESMVDFVYCGGSGMWEDQYEFCQPSKLYETIFFPYQLINLFFFFLLTNSSNNNRPTTSSD